MEQPLVSVVIPFYSGLNWLKEAIDSVINQLYKNIEILVINDGSEEDISSINRLYGDRIKIVNKPNGGPASARNMGIELSSGKYIAFLDSDDIWYPNKLSIQIDEMEKNNYVWSQHSYVYFWEDSGSKEKVINTSIYSGNIYKDCFISCKIQTSCVVVLKQILLEHNIRFPLEKRYGQDGHFFKQIAKLYPIGYVDGVLTKFRIRGTNAGFRAKVQINDKASTWDEIKYDSTVLNMLPTPVIISYKMSSIYNKWIKNTRIRNEKIAEYFSKVLYTFPYLIFKIYARRR